MLGIETLVEFIDETITTMYKSKWQRCINATLPHWIQQIECFACMHAHERGVVF